MMVDPGIDPVCGMAVDPGSAAAQVHHDGVTYSFCSEACSQTFMADPGQFVTASPPA